METLTYTLTLAGLLVCNMLVAKALSWLLTEWKRPLFNFKPFNCRPCLSFWLTLGIGSPLVFLYGAPIGCAFAVCAVLVLTGLINYIIIKNKIQIYE